LSDRPAIQVSHLSKRFGPVQAVDDVSFELAQGEILGLLGPNGAGKTTTIQLLLGLTTPDSGRIEILGLDLARRRREILTRVNFSSAYVSLPTNLTAWENLNIFAKLYGLKRPRARIEALLDMFEIPEVLNRKTGALSSGQLTRLNLCKAFLNRPEILFLDEPTASLDPDMAAKVRDNLLRIQAEQGASMIYTSHNMNEVQLICHRIVFLARGRIIVQGRTDQVLAQAHSQSLEELFITISRSGELKDARAGEAHVA